MALHLKHAYLYAVILLLHFFTLSPSTGQASESMHSLFMMSDILFLFLFINDLVTEEVFESRIKSHFANSFLYNCIYFDCSACRESEAA